MNGLPNDQLACGWRTPNNLVFLKKEDYERLDRNLNFKYLINKGDIRNPFERDRARIIHSPFFRSLGGKTQMFEISQSDFFRSRLTHSLEVAQIGKSMASALCEKYRRLGKRPELSLWEQIHLCDLVEAVCLAHDIGIPPFGHIGSVPNFL